MTDRRIKSKTKSKPKTSPKPKSNQKLNHMAVLNFYNFWRKMWYAYLKDFTLWMNLLLLRNYFQSYCTPQRLFEGSSSKLAFQKKRSSQLEVIQYLFVKLSEKKLDKLFLQRTHFNARITPSKKRLRHQNYCERTSIFSNQN